MSLIFWPHLSAKFILIRRPPLLNFAQFRGAETYSDQIFIVFLRGDTPHELSQACNYKFDSRFLKWCQTLSPMVGVSTLETTTS